jgi:hypothetical protein
VLALHIAEIEAPIWWTQVKFVYATGEHMLEVLPALLR